MSGSPKAPLTTIAENWESSVTERNQIKADEDTSSDSESEGLSGRGCQLLKLYLYLKNMEQKLFNIIKV